MILKWKVWVLQFSLLCHKKRNSLVLLLDSLSDSQLVTHAYSFIHVHTNEHLNTPTHTLCLKVAQHKMHLHRVKDVRGGV